MINDISYIGLKDLTDDEQKILRGVLDKEYPKIKRITPNIKNIMVHAKVYSRLKARKYSVHLKVDTPEEFFTSHATDWDLATVTHKVISKISKEINSKLDVEKTKAREIRLKNFLRNIISR